MGPPPACWDLASDVIVCPRCSRWHDADHFREQKALHKKYVVQILLAVLRQFQALPNLISIQTATIPVSHPGETLTLTLTLP